MRTKLKKAVLPIIPLVMIGLIVSISSCCEDCIINPTSQPYRGWVYASDANTNRIYMIDTETDSVVDSVSYDPQGEYWPNGMDVSQDGRFLAVGYDNGADEVTRIFDAQTLETITDLDIRFIPVFASEDNLLIGVDQISITQSRVLLYSIPDFALLDEIVLDFTVGYPRVDTRSNLIYFFADSSSANPDSSFFGAFNYIDRELSQTWILRDDDSTWINVADFDVRADDNRLYFTGFTRVNHFTRAWLGIYDLDSSRLIKKSRIYEIGADIRLSINGDYLYRAELAEGEYIGGGAGVVYVYDANSGSFVEGISLYGYDTLYQNPLFCNELAFTPDGDKIYLGTGRFAFGSGTVVVIDAYTNKITKLIWPELGHYNSHVVIGPKL